MSSSGTALTTRNALARGMTLVEVIVAMAVLSLIVLVLGASLRGMAQSAQRIDQRVDAIDEMRVTVAFLREVFGRLADARGSATDQGLIFSACNPAEVTWVAAMPARFGAAGRHHFKLALEEAADSTPALVLRFAPWQGATERPDWSGSGARVLVRDVRRFEMSYGGQGMQSAWRAQWEEERQPPPRLRLVVETANQSWPPVILPIRVQMARPGSGRFVIGGGTP